jgi:hypothetical protein
MSIRIPIISTFDYRGIRQAEKGVSGFSSKMLKAGGIITGVFAALTAAVALPVKALFDLGAAFDDAFDKIRIGTGETGQVLAGLEESFRNVVAGSPSSFEDVSTAIADLNTRLGITGPELELLADQFTTLSRITGEDLAGLIENTTRLFNRANVPIEEQSGLLDMLFRASQKSGVSVADLAREMDEYRTQFEASGFAVDEQLALLALFNREGVRTESIISAMASAQRRFARENVPLTEGMQDLIEEIRTVDETLAYSKGAEYFGRNAVEMVDAIRSGRLNYEEMANAILNGEDSIMSIAEETDDLTEAWDRFKNYLKLTFEDAALSVFGEVSKFVDEELVGAAQRVKEAFEEGGIEAAITQVGEEFRRIYSEYLKPLWEDDIKPFFEDTVKPQLERIAINIGNAVGEGISNAIENKLRRWALTVSIPPILQPFRDKIIAFLDFSRIFRDAAREAEQIANLPSPGGGGGGNTVSRVPTFGSPRLSVESLDSLASSSTAAIAPGAIQVTVNVSGSAQPMDVRRAVDMSMDDAIARLARELAVS